MRPILRKSVRGIFRFPRPATLRRRRALTIVELVVVVLVMGMLAAVATPAFLDSLLFHRVESAARRVKADLELARHTARLTSATQSVSFTTIGYTLNNVPNASDKPNAQYVVDLAAPPFELDSVAANFPLFVPTTSISFDGYGAPSSPGTVVLKCKRHECTVALDGTTGEVTITSNHAGGGTAEVVGN